MKVKNSAPGWTSVCPLGIAVLASVALFIVVASGCSSGNRDGDDATGGPVTQPPGGGGGTLTAPILFSLGTNDSLLCVGDVIELIGVNFSQSLRENVVTFRSGRTIVRGTPLAVVFPVDNNRRDGVDSRLRVLVPTGVISGSVELAVSGINAGGLGYIACPLVYGYTIGSGGQPGNFPAVVHGGILGFDPQFGPETILIHGINFDEVTQIQVFDDSNNTQTITAANFQRRTLQPDNGMETILFSLVGVRLAIQDSRANIHVRALSPDFTANEVSVPMISQQNFGGILGPAINGVVIPTGVRNGPLRLRYSMYDDPISTSYDMVVDWTADGGNTWMRAATPAQGIDHLNDGDFKVVPGHIEFGPPAGIVRGGGGLKQYTWDADNDQLFRQLNETIGAGGSTAPRGWTLSFRFRAIPLDDEMGTRPIPGVLFHTPPIAYYDLEDRPGDPIPSQRTGQFTEGFTTTALKTRDCTTTQVPLVDECTTAIWGPDSLEGNISDRPPAQFGTGTLDIDLSLQEDPATVVDEFYVVDTTRMQIDHIVITPDPVDPANGPADVVAFPVFPDRLTNVVNPGEALGEFHMRTLRIGEDTRIECVGSRPLVIKLSGTGDVQDLVYVQEPNSVIMASGFSAPDANPGAGALGGGNGGGGATGNLYTILQAQRGANGGGFPGESPMAVGPNVAAISRVYGGPGGGGGARLPGNPGDSATPVPTLFKAPIPGDGGPKRGASKLLELVPGSGGGGGGIGVTRAANATSPTDGAAADPGGGGGGGGGAVKISGRGSFLVEGVVNCNGGAGYSTGRNSGPGGGGSGGSIFLEATGFATVDCGLLFVEGGAAGTASQMNRVPGAGNGGAGWIRVTSGFGGLPFCGLLALETVLTQRLSESTASNTRIDVASTAGFPPSGTVVIDDEVIGYASLTATRFEDLTRGLRGTRITAHEVDSIVALDATVFPAAAMGTDLGIEPAPDVFDARNGLDEVLHCYFIASLDPETGQPLRDAAGTPLSIWTFDTDRGIVRDPLGSIVKTTVSSDTEPGVMQLTRLIIDPAVTLRGVGRRPMEILVQDVADIAGHLDLDGQDGGLLVFDSDSPAEPLPGVGGTPGPGGGPGGTGGTILFLDGDVTNRAITNIEPVSGAAGQLPFVLRGTATPTLGMPLDPATAGTTLRDPRCESNRACVETAGGGGGGGHREVGQNGAAQPTGAGAGVGGGTFGRETLRFGGEYELVGGGGGGGGGGNPARSTDYLDGNAGPSLFRGQAAYGPGTGGGGGGGVLRLVVNGELILRSTSAITVDGGNAYQSIDLAGNGGAGSAGTIFIQVSNALTIETSAKLSARGGKANLPVPIDAGQAVPTYEGNIRASSGTSFGGKGGNGSYGRIRIEAPAGSNLAMGGLNESFAGGVTLIDMEDSYAFSREFRLGIGPGNGVLTQDLVLTKPTIRSGRFGNPPGTDRELTWEAAPESTDVFGEVGGFVGGVSSLGDLRDYDFVRFVAVLRSNTVTFEVPVVREITTTYEKAYLDN